MQYSYRTSVHACSYHFSAQLTIPRIKKINSHAIYSGEGSCLIIKFIHRGRPVPVDNSENWNALENNALSVSKPVGTFHSSTKPIGPENSATSASDIVNIFVNKVQSFPLSNSSTSGPENMTFTSFDVLDKQHGHLGKINTDQVRA